MRFDSTFNNEEVKRIIQNLCDKTQKNSISWVCDEYNPASFLLGDKYGEGDERKPFISHIATLVYAPTGGSRYILEISGSIQIDKNAPGCLHPKISVYDADEALLYLGETVIDEGGDDEFGFIPLCDAVFERAGEWLDEDSFTYVDDHHFYPEKGVTKKHRAFLLCRLMEQLMNERCVCDFHRIIMDRPYVVGNNSGNSRNGYNRKTIISDYGESEIVVPRDRNGEFEPRVLEKGQTRTDEIEQKILAMYSKGMSQRDKNNL